ncbi:MarR family winged helix-turn-helix transcriptional regulator [Georgenia alba]|uniref:MarR family winged helix-turn-helix transcriptional regulator n=1 Tax=Georgenia alba TaxID=2233858 RepID=A0ABW2Q2Q4_9MICO
MRHRGPKPVAVALWQTMQQVTREFDELLLAHGGSRQIWHILLAIQEGPYATQRELAAAVGIREATLTHHLRVMEERGLVARHRSPQNRRVQEIEITPDGLALFGELRDKAMGFDRRLRRALGSSEDVETFRGALSRISAALDDGRPIAPLG